MCVRAFFAINFFQTVILFVYDSVSNSHTKRNECHPATLCIFFRPQQFLKNGLMELIWSLFSVCAPPSTPEKFTSEKGICVLHKCVCVVRLCGPLTLYDPHNQLDADIKTNQNVHRTECFVALFKLARMRSIPVGCWFFISFFSHSTGHFTLVLFPFFFGLPKLSLNVWSMVKQYSLKFDFGSKYIRMLNLFILNIYLFNYGIYTRVFLSFASAFSIRCKSS